MSKFFAVAVWTFALLTAVGAIANPFGSGPRFGVDHLLAALYYLVFTGGLFYVGLHLWEPRLRQRDKPCLR